MLQQIEHLKQLYLSHLGSGELKMTSSNLLPIAVPASASSCHNPAGCSLVGDVRGDENIVLSAMHTLFARHHNIIARALKRRHRRWNEHKLFETARKINIAVYQKIVYNEFVSVLGSVERYRGYKPYVDASIVAVFSTAAFRFGHSLVPNSWAMLDKSFNKAMDDISLQASFFNTTSLRTHGIEPIVYGLCANQSQVVDTKFASGLVRKLFVPVGHHGYSDLAALNIQRGRDHGIRTYGHWRRLCRLKTLNTWKDLIGLIPASVIKAFKKLYKRPHDIDIFAAGIAEKHVRGKALGETFHCIVTNQFERLREGDRFYYERSGVFTWAQRRSINRMTMAKVLCNTLNGVVSMQRKALEAFIPGSKRPECTSIPGLDMRLWWNGYMNFGNKLV